MSIENTAAENAPAANDTFAELEAEALRIDQQQQQAAQPIQAPKAEKQPSINDAFKPTLMQILSYGTTFASSQIPIFTEHYTPQHVENIADSILKVADVEGVDLSKLAYDTESRAGAWINLLIAVGMPTVTFYFAFKAQQAKASKVEKPVYTTEATTP